MSSYKVSYFNVKGLGEPIRYLLSYNGVDFEDIRCPRDEWNDEKKKEKPFGKMPTLEVNGELPSDSAAILRYLTAGTALSGATPKENLHIDQVMGAIEDLNAETRKVLRPESEESRVILQEQLVPFYFERFEDLLKDNGGYLANGKLSWVDFYLVAWGESLETVCGIDLPKLYPGYGSLKQRVMSLPGIKEYIAERPPTVL